MTSAAALSEPRGTAAFTGARFHCRRWDSVPDVRGRRVAVVGSAAAVARVLPVIAARAERVTVFQHDAAWMLPRVPMSGLLTVVPARLSRCAARANLRVQVSDKWLRRQLTPEENTGVRLHSNYYRALLRPNCRLVTWPIATLAPLGIRTVDGIEHRVDCIVFAHV